MTKSGIITGIIVIIIAAVGVYLVHRPQAVPVDEPVIGGKLSGNPTTFAHEGKITFIKNGGQVSVPFFTYITSEGEVATTTLLFDPISACATHTGSEACVAMNTTLDIPFGNKRAIVEGIRMGNLEDEESSDELLVRKMFILNEGEAPLVPGTGSIFITWPQAVEFITSCSVTLVTQTHALDVFLTFEDGTRLRAVEPMIDEVFKVIEKVRPMCGDIPVATE